ncbi:ACP S-malonyltransferase [Candidatus Aerophobetes bacterium]|nr:ACP S-malonyltransferase [Candidatus Aerophobetes bacterium]
MKIAFLFPGQGSQQVGMGKEIFSLYSKEKEIFQQARKILGFDVEKLCLYGSEEDLKKTYYLQPSLLILSYITAKLLEKNGIYPVAVAGHSLGEWTAVAVSEVVDYPDALKIIYQRARLMEEASIRKGGGMAAVIGLNREKVINICQQVGEVEAVNFNCPSQVVISGKKEKVDEAGKRLKREGAKRVIPLPVSGAFHSFLMREAASKFSKVLDKFKFFSPRYPIVCNASACYAKTNDEVKRNLKKQMDHPVLWEDSMKRLIRDGVNVFVEVGPGKVLQNLLRRIDKGVTTLGVESKEDIEKLCNYLGKRGQATFLLQ